MPAAAEETRETILVVDDDASVLKIVVAVLEGANFRVLSAAGGPEALQLASNTVETIDLLLSDVDMPQISGPDLGQTLKKARPAIRVMLMSGGSNGDLLVLNYGWAFLAKPFLPVKLVEMVTHVLHCPDRSQPGGHQFDNRQDFYSKS